MRPRPDAAENLPARSFSRRTATGFNEAAARCRGKPMRRAEHCCASKARFNEAAARCRGKLGSAPAAAAAVQALQ